MRRWRLLAWEAVVPVVILALWLAATASDPPYYLSSPADLFAAIAHQVTGGGLAENLAPSLQKLLVGFGLGSAAAVVIGVVLGVSSPVGRALAPILEYLRALPPPALLPLAFVVLGLGQVMAVSVIVFGVVWPVLLNTIDGVRSVDGGLHEMSRVYHLPWHYRLAYVLLPSAAPAIMSGMRLGLSLAVALMVISEMAGSVAGMGHFTLVAERDFAISDMWAGMLMLGVMGYLLNLAFGAVERRLLFWQVANQPAGQRI